MLTTKAPLARSVPQSQFTFLGWALFVGANSTHSVLVISSIWPVAVDHHGGKGIRTPDLFIANESLYQLSYTPIRSIKSHFAIGSNCIKQILRELFWGKLSKLLTLIFSVI